MFRSPRAAALRIAALVIGALTARMVVLDLRAVHEQAHSLGPVQAVVSARHTLRVGHLVAGGDLTVVRRHTGQLPPGTFTAAASVVGRAVTVDVAAGAPLLAANIGVGGVGTSGALGADERVVRVVDAGGMTPEVGAIVDVYATFSATAPGGTDATELVARGARVLRVDRDDADLHATAATRSAPGASGATGILLMVTSADTPQLASAVANGAVTVAIAPVEDACCADPERPRSPPRSSRAARWPAR